MTGSLVHASPDGEYAHDDSGCAETDTGEWPALEMSETAADSYGLDDCPDCRAEADPGYGLDMTVADFSAGERVAAKTVAQWFAGEVEARYRPTDDGVAGRIRCTADQGYTFIVEETTAGRTRVEKEGGVTANVLDLARSKR